MDRHEIHIRWNDTEAKRAWMRALALLLDRLKPHLDNQADRERFVLVNERLDAEFKEEGIKRPTGLRQPFSAIASVGDYRDVPERWRRIRRHD